MTSGRIPYVKSENRHCANCNSKETTVRKTTGYEQWYRFREEWICQKCHNTLVKNPKFHPIKNPQRMLFKNRHMQLGINPRIGVCNLCRHVVPFDCKKTDMHHEKYHSKKPLKDVIEVCPSCHRKQRN